MNTAEIKLYDFLRKELKLDDSRAKVFTEVLYESIENQTNKTATEYKSSLKEDFYKIDLKIEQLNSKIAESKSDTIKWFVGLFFALSLMILGLYLKK